MSGVLFFGDRPVKKRARTLWLGFINNIFYINNLILNSKMWHASCKIILSGSFTFLCQTLRERYINLRMTHNKVPAVQLLIIAMRYQTSGDTLSKAPPHFTRKAG